jgi:predicted ATPase
MKKRHSKPDISAISPPSKDGGFFYAERTPTPQIVLTGPPACGKTTTLAQLGKLHPNILTVNEAATQVLKGGFPPVTAERAWSQTWQNALQHAIIGHQLGLEMVAQEDARTGQNPAILLDRGLVDNAAYLRGGIAELEDYTGIEHQAMLKRYHAVIFLGRLAQPYETQSNPQRFEDETHAQALAARTLEAWQEHPKLIAITSTDNRANDIIERFAEVLQNLERTQ